MEVLNQHQSPGTSGELYRQHTDAPRSVDRAMVSRASNWGLTGRDSSSRIQLIQDADAIPLYPPLCYADRHILYDDTHASPGHLSQGIAVVPHAADIATERDLQKATASHAPLQSGNQTAPAPYPAPHFNPYASEDSDDDSMDCTFSFGDLNSDTTLVADEPILDARADKDRRPTTEVHSGLVDGMCLTLDGPKEPRGDVMATTDAKPETAAGFELDMLLDEAIASITINGVVARAPRNTPSSPMGGHHGGLFRGSAEPEPECERGEGCEQVPPTPASLHAGNDIARFENAVPSAKTSPGLTAAEGAEAGGALCKISQSALTPPAIDKENRATACTSESSAKDLQVEVVREVAGHPFCGGTHRAGLLAITDAASSSSVPSATIVGGQRALDVEMPELDISDTGYENTSCPIAAGRRSLDSRGQEHQRMQGAREDESTKNMAGIAVAPPTGRVPLDEEDQLTRNEVDVRAAIEPMELAECASQRNKAMVEAGGTKQHEDDTPAAQAARHHSDGCCASQADAAAHMSDTSITGLGTSELQAVSTHRLAVDGDDSDMSYIEQCSEPCSAAILELSVPAGQLHPTLTRNNTCAITANPGTHLAAIPESRQDHTADFTSTDSSSFEPAAQSLEPQLEQAHIKMEESEYDSTRIMQVEGTNDVSLTDFPCDKLGVQMGESDRPAQFRSIPAQSEQPEENATSPSLPSVGRKKRKRRSGLAGELLELVSMNEKPPDVRSARRAGSVRATMAMPEHKGDEPPRRRSRRSKGAEDGAEQAVSAVTAPAGREQVAASATARTDAPVASTSDPGDTVRRALPMVQQAQAPDFTWAPETFEAGTGELGGEGERTDMRQRCSTSPLTELSDTGSAAPSRTGTRDGSSPPTSVSLRSLSLSGGHVGPPPPDCVQEQQEALGSRTGVSHAVDQASQQEGTLPSRSGSASTPSSSRNSSGTPQPAAKKSAAHASMQQIATVVGKPTAPESKITPALPKHKQKEHQGQGTATPVSKAATKLRGSSTAKPAAPGSGVKRPLATSTGNTSGKSRGGGAGRGRGRGRGRGKGKTTGRRVSRIEVESESDDEEDSDEETVCSKKRAADMQRYNQRRPKSKHMEERCSYSPAQPLLGLATKTEGPFRAPSGRPVIRQIRQTVASEQDGDLNEEAAAGIDQDVDSDDEGDDSMDAMALSVNCYGRAAVSGPRSPPPLLPPAQDRDRAVRLLTTLYSSAGERAKVKAEEKQRERAATPSFLAEQAAKARQTDRPTVPIAEQRLHQQHQQQRQQSCWIEPRPDLFGEYKEPDANARLDPGCIAVDPQLAALDQSGWKYDLTAGEQFALDHLG